VSTLDLECHEGLDSLTLWEGGCDIPQDDRLVFEKGEDGRVFTWA
jgi:hypothetical protein